ncbi:MAG: spoIIM [Firmicutes bacterium]|nr:spoIIM [Bacillota bacterium]
MPLIIRPHVTEYLRANVVMYFFMTLLFVAGVVGGALAVKLLPEEQKAELCGYLSIFFQGLSQGASDTNSVSLFFSVLLNNCKTIALLWLLGFTVIGIPLVLFIVLTRGFIIGFTVGFLVNEYIMKGVAFALVAVLPHNFFSVPAVLVSGVSAVSYSIMLVRRRFRGKNVSQAAMGYTGICLLMMLVMLASTVVEVYISPVLMKLVSGLFLHS